LSPHFIYRFLHILQNSNHPRIQLYNVTYSLGKKGVRSEVRHGSSKHMPNMKRTIIESKQLKNVTVFFLKTFPRIPVCKRTSLFVSGRKRSQITFAFDPMQTLVCVFWVDRSPVTNTSRMLSCPLCVSKATRTNKQHIPTQNRNS